ncbi:MAG: hypothetical protein RL441_1683, partial [Actinomycetota bacterium]
SLNETKERSELSECACHQTVLSDLNMDKTTAHTSVNP